MNLYKKRFKILVNIEAQQWTVKFNIKSFVWENRLLAHTYHKVSDHCLVWIGS